MRARAKRGPPICCGKITSDVCAATVKGDMERAANRRGRRSRALRLLRALEPRRALFVLPNLFTLSSVFCGFFAIVVASGESSPRRLSQAVLAVFFSVFFDM